jgi:hypothetical protein
MAQAMSNGRLRRERGSWPLREEQDAFGQRLETELGEFLETEAAIEQATDVLSRDFKAHDFYGEAHQEAEPGGIPDIVDFAGILCFGSSGDGAPFCLDYRANPEHPRIIWWDDAYWRVVAPDFDTFLRLFEI